MESKRTQEEFRLEGDRGARSSNHSGELHKQEGANAADYSPDSALITEMIYLMNYQKTRGETEARRLDTLDVFLGICFGKLSPDERATIADLIETT